MGFQAFCRILVTALVAATFVQASPFWAMDVQDFGLSRRDTLVSHQCSDLVVGATRSPDIGTVCVDLTGGAFTITYTITTAGWTFNAVHAWVGTSVPTSTIPGNAPGKFPYTSSNSFCTISGSVATCTVSPIPDAWRSCTGNLWIVAHADVTDPTGTQQTAWDNGQCYDTKGNCAKYFTVAEQCQCPILYSFEPITSSTTYLVTVVTTTTVSCSTTPDPRLTTTSCGDPNAPTTTSTIATTTSVNLVCPSPSP